MEDDLVMHLSNQMHTLVRNHIVMVMWYVTAIFISFQKPQAKACAQPTHVVPLTTTGQNIFNFQASFFSQGKAWIAS